MKTFKIIIYLFCFGLSISSVAQSSQDIIKVSYTGGCVSDFLVGLIKKQMPDDQEFSSMISMMEGYKIHSTYYHNTKTQEAVFVLDSIDKVDHLHTTGHTYSIYKNASGNIIGKEQFMGKDINFSGKVNELNWVFTKDQKDINGYSCKKAYLSHDPDIYAWFTTELAVSGGPYIFHGLPGLVLESNTAFESIDVNSISYADASEFEAKKKTAKEMSQSPNAISFSEMFSKKENFQRIVQNGTE